MEEMHEIKTIIFTHKILNCKENFFYKDLLTQNRQRKTLAENKIGIMKNGYGLKHNEQNTFIYKAFSVYNNIPRELTLIIKGSTLKKTKKIL